MTVIKDLKVKGSSSVLKVGTKVKNIRLVDGDHDIDCKIDGFGAMSLKSEFVKRYSARIGHKMGREMSQQSQNYQNHRRIHPLFHVLLTLMTAGLFISAVVELMRSLKAGSQVFPAVLF